MKKIERDYSGMKVGLTVGSKRKKRLSNYLSISISDQDAKASEIRLTLRQAKVIARLLQDNLDLAEQA